MNIVVCGRGRLASLIVQVLDKQEHRVQFARVDAERGLLSDEPLVSDIDRLLLCFVPRHGEERSGWSGLLDGLVRQCAQKKLKIQRVLHISSSAVYACHAQGWCDANTAVHAMDARTEGLLEAESAVQKLSAQSSSVRLPGLIGGGYTHYDPYRFSSDKARHALDITRAAPLLAWLLMQDQRVQALELLTDGAVYWQGQRYALTQTEQLDELART